MPQPEMGMDMMPQEPQGEMPANNPMPPMDEPQDTDGGKSEFDTDFDAGVEADEDEDPKKFVQQLTGKLSTTLGSYLNENGDDDGLCKYVAKMIIKQAAKGLDEKSKKELIKTINGEDEEDSSDKEDNAEPMDAPQDAEMPQEEPMEEPMNENVYKVGSLRKLTEGLITDEEPRKEEKLNKDDSIFSGKKFTN